MAIFVFFVTIFVGLFGAGIFGNLLRWPGAGAVFAIATVGAFLMREVRKLTWEEPPELAEDPWKKREREAKEKAEREREAKEKAEREQEDSQP